MRVNGTIFNVDLIDVLAELKRQLSANGVHLFAKMFDSGDDVMVCCPYHKDGQERRPSAGIRKSDAKLHCFTCDKTVDLPEMIANCFGYTDPSWGYHWLTTNFLTVGVSDREAIKINVGRVNFPDKASLLEYSNSNKSVVAVSEEELDKYRYTHKYMYERGLNDAVIDFFDIGYDVDSDSITFPVKDISGNCLFVARRSVRNKQFNIPKDIDKPLYGLYECCSQITYLEDVPDKKHNYVYKIPSNLPEVYVCEGLFDCLRLWCNGKIAVAGFGCLFSEYQLKQLRELPTRRLILALDNDDAGRDGAERIRCAVKNKLIDTAVIPQGKKDIGELTDEQINSLEIEAIKRRLR